MCNPIFDYDDGNFIYQTSGNMGIDSDGDLHMRMGDNMSMDMDTRELHFSSSQKNNDTTISKPKSRNSRPDSTLLQVNDFTPCFIFKILRN